MCLHDYDVQELAEQSKVALEKDRAQLKGKLARAEDALKQAEDRAQQAEARAIRLEAALYEAQDELKGTKAQLEAANVRQEALAKDAVDDLSSGQLQRAVVEKDADLKAARQQVKDLTTRLQAAVQGHAEAEVGVGVHVVHVAVVSFQPRLACFGTGHDQRSEGHH